MSEEFGNNISWTFRSFFLSISSDTSLGDEAQTKGPNTVIAGSSQAPIFLVLRRISHFAPCYTAQMLTWLHIVGKGQSVKFQWNGSPLDCPEQEALQGGTASGHHTGLQPLPGAAGWPITVAAAHEGPHVSLNYSVMLV